MNQYVTGTMIKKCREAKGLTQACLAELLNVSDKAVSKWETGKGLPDITLLEPIATALGISVAELLAGNNITNENRSFHMMRAKLYVCPVCGNVINSVGEAMVSCCGVTLPVLEAEEPDAVHPMKIERVEDEYYVTVSHEMTKDHYISFIAAMTDNGIHMVKMYPEGNAEARFPIGPVRSFYYYCNRHGLFRMTAKASSRKALRNGDQNHL